MEITAKFNNGEEMMAFARLLLGQDNAVKFVPSHGVVANVEPLKEDTEKQEEKPKEVNIPKVEAEVVGIDATPEELNEAKELIDKKKEEPKVTKEMVRAAFSKLIKDGKQKEAKELTSKYGAAKLPDVKEEDYAAILKEAEELL